MALVACFASAGAIKSEHSRPATGRTDRGERMQDSEPGHL